VAWYVNRKGKRYGPFSNAGIGRLARAQKLRPSDLVWRKGMLQWTPAQDVPGLLSPPLVISEPEEPIERRSNTNEHSYPASSSPQKANYFIRHWRGELSLGVSYWINGVLLTIPFLVAIAFAISIDLTEYPEAFAWSIIGLWCMILLLTPV